jgi:NitT/TauT family transport system substrate-binding protein
MESITVGIVQADPCANVYYTQARGLFAAEGLDVRMQRLPGVRDRGHTGAALKETLTEPVTSGAFDFAIANVVTLAAARAAGIPVRFVAPATVILPRPLQIDQIMVLRESTIAPGAGCNGKTFALNRLHNVQEPIAKEWVARHGGDPDSIRFIEAAFSVMDEELRSGRADVIMATEPFTPDFAKVIGNPFEVIGERFMLNGWFAADAWLERHAGQAAKFARAMSAGSDWANTHQDESAQILADQEGTRVTVEVARKMVRAEYGLALEPAMLAPMIDIAVRNGLLDAPLAPEELIWTAAG